MRIVLDEQKAIVSYVLIGDVEGSVEYNGELPDDFITSFKPMLFKLQGDEIVRNPDYCEPETPMRDLTEQDKINAYQFKMNLDFKKQLEEMRHDE
ncbi:DUF2977 domain-containing protein [Latilactobacillus curvatus]|uniref:DUF2977 domain-containing protein n=1 Tax=Latilactobacillus curvatus TaxID=28038 RepID=UPI0020C7BA0F|nr:DUF2977 domain-containing protein [Latilactobacillus curvatus]MCP8849194.1 DUF2977 domain-containing protein [Latilactobacillus curvatus]